MRIIVLRGWRESALDVLKLMLGMAALGAAVTVARSIPDVARYWKMRRM
jgi:hypothetical protein